MISIRMCRKKYTECKKISKYYNMKDIKFAFIENMKI